MTVLSSKEMFGLYGIFLIFLRSTQGIYLNHTSQNLSTSLNITTGFSFAFRTCSQAVFLHQGENDFTLSLQQTESQFHPKLIFKWSFNNGLNNTSIEFSPLFSIDSNIYTFFSLSLNSSIAAFQMTTKEFGSQKIYIPLQYFNNSQITGPLVLGSSNFLGCVENGGNVNTPRFQSICPLDNLAPCSTTGCIVGYTGRHCEENINDCKGEEQCHSFSQCIDLVNGFKCKCGRQWTGRLCNKFLGSLCDPSPCLNNGVCRLSVDKNDYICTCLNGLSGKNCTDVFNPCTSSPCKNNATCTNISSTEYNCTCLPDFVGSYCESNIDNCRDKPCNLGVCVDMVLNYSCNCTGTGFTGENCKTDIDECIINKPCVNGSCENQWGTYKCKCDTGFTGQNCDENINDCAGLPCSNNGSCQDLVNDYKCECALGFSGKNCTVNIDDCARKPCVADNILSPCVDAINDYHCECKPGFQGKDCEDDINECLVLTPCKNNATCLDLVGSYQCNCVAGYNGTNCTEDINECALNPCSNGGSCDDHVNNYTCRCTTGFTGRNCEVNIDDCADQPCLRGNCSDGVNNYTCSCIPSFTGRNCTIYLDLCASNPCKNNAQCLNDTLKGFVCNCSENFTGDTCEHKLGVCYPDNPCVNGKCKEVGATYNCSCDSGYIGENCSVNLDECKSGVCKNGAQCVDTLGSFYCNCTQGFEGQLCDSDVDECLNYPCFNNATCINTIGDYQCKCTDGFIDKNCDYTFEACRHFQRTNSEPYCKHNSACVELGSRKMKCDCVVGYTGTRCGIDINECESGFCKNNATCADLVADYNCTCSPGFYGRNCTQEVDECLPNPCKNNAECSDLINAFKCNCKPGYNGTACEHDIEWCAVSPCKNGGLCTETVEHFNCSCLPGFAGANCSVDVKECVPNPCVYEGVFESVCVERSNLTAMRELGKPVNQSSFHDRDGYICECAAGLVGDNCTVNIDDCSPSSCQHNGTCYDLVNGFNCSCLSGYEGLRCENETNECAGNPCKNGAACMDLLNDYNCNCTEGFHGKNCQLGLCANTSVCENGATCQVTLSGVACNCAHGWMGKHCRIPTTVNFNTPGGRWSFNNDTSSYANVSFRFATTLENALLMALSRNQHQIIQFLIYNGKFTLRSVKESLSFDRLNDSWHTVSLNFNSDTLHVMLNGRKLTNSALNRTSFRSMYIGGANNAEGSFIGCLQDVRVNGAKLDPSASGDLVNAVVGACRRNKVCAQSPCFGRGLCKDLWFKKECVCRRQYFGESCESEITAFSFRSRESISSANSTSRVKRSTREIHILATFDSVSIGNNTFSFLIRTRTTNAFLALLLAYIPTASASTFPYIHVGINDTKLFVAHKNKRVTTSEMISDGKWHEVEINQSSITVDKSHFSLDLPTISVKNIYLGGVANPVLYQSVPSINDVFKGCLQAVKFSGNLITNQVIPGVKAVPPRKTGVKMGCPGQPVCDPISPCLFNGTCVDVWNAFECTCRTGFKGKTCELYGCQHFTESCPKPSECIDLYSKPGAITCAQGLTFNGVNSSSSTAVSNRNATTLSFILRTRQSNAFVMTVYNAMDNYLAVLIVNGNLVVKARYGINKETLQVAKVNDGLYNEVAISRASLNKTSIKLNEGETMKVNKPVFTADWFNIISNGTISVGMTSLNISNFAVPYKGCLSNLTLGSASVDINKGSINTATGCVSDNPCKDNPCDQGSCKDVFNEFQCNCKPFYTKKTCNETVNITCAFSRPLCNNSGVCANISEGVSPSFSDNGRDFFKCNCSKGYSGEHCNQKDYACSHTPCKNNGTCADVHPGYECTCVENYFGNDCEYNNTMLCEKKTPCLNGTCTDNIHGASCVCHEGFYGTHCERDFGECSELEPCANNGACEDSHSSLEFGAGYACHCTKMFEGRNCTVEKKAVDDTNLIIGISVAVAFIVLVIIVILLVKCCKDKSGMEGTYSPNREEQQSGQVEMNTLKKPNAERLI